MIAKYIKECAVVEGILPWSLGLLLLLLATAVTFCNGCSHINKKVGLADDNPIEEAIEDFLEDKIDGATGIRPDIDLTP